ncbi:hypothetical protein BDW68DRAFT_194567 [Aspergillus falconensis]
MSTTTSTTTITKNTELKPTAPIPNNSSSSSFSYNTFPLFPFLPPELRLQIWTLTLSSSLSEPRTVIITCHRAVHPVQGRRYAKTFSTSTETPPLLLVNHEARTEALRVYRPHFFQIPIVQIDIEPAYPLRSRSRLRIESEDKACEQRGDGYNLDEGCSEGQGYVHVQKPKSIYIAFDREILRLRDDVLSYIPELELGLIERMVVDVADVHYFGRFYLDIIRNMNKLRMLELVVGVADSDRMLARRGTGVGNRNGGIGGIERWAKGGLRRLERDIELLKDEFREMRESDEKWDCPEVRIVMRGSGVVMGVMEGGRGSSMADSVGIPA